MVLSLGIDGNNDLFLNSTFSISTSEDQQAIAETLTARISTLKGELIFNLAGGVEYMNGAFANSAEGMSKFRTDVENTILSTQNVRSLQSLDMWVDGIVLNFQAVVVTDFGTIALSNVPSY